MHAHTETHSHSNARTPVVLTQTHTHTKKAKNAKFIRITCLFSMCITVGLSHIVTLISIFCHFGARFFAVCCTLFGGVRSAHTNYQHKQCCFLYAQQEPYSSGRTQKMSFFISTTKTNRRRR